MIVLKKEVIKTNNVTEHEDTDKYRQLLVRTLHSCSVRFPDMAANVIPVVICLSFNFTNKTDVLNLSPSLRLLNLSEPVCVPADGVPERHERGGGR